MKHWIYNIAEQNMNRWMKYEFTEQKNDTLNIKWRLLNKNMKLQQSGNHKPSLPGENVGPQPEVSRYFRKVYRLRLGMILACILRDRETFALPSD